MCQTEDLLIRQQQEDRIEKYQKNLLKLTRKTKTAKIFSRKTNYTYSKLGKVYWELLTQLKR